MEKKRISEEQNKKLEMICVAVLIAFALLFFFFTKVKKHDDSKYSKVSIYIGSKNVWQSNIKDLKDENIIVYSDDQDILSAEVIENERNDIKEKYAYNIIEIKDKKVRCIESNCPNKVCISHGTLIDTIDNDMIICAPHKMTVVYE